MRRLRPSLIALMIAACGATLAPGSFPLIATAHAQEALRPEIGKPLKAAQDLYKAKKYQEALAKINEADQVSGKSKNETLTIERMRGSVAMAAGDYNTAAKSFESAINSGALPAAEQLKLMEALAGIYYRNKDYGKTTTWANRYIKEGGTNPQIKALINEAVFSSGDYASAAKTLAAEVQAAEKSGSAPSSATLIRLATAYEKLKDENGYASTIEKLVQYYPKKEYWADVIHRTQLKSGFSDRLQLDVFRLKQITGNLADANAYMEMTQLALQAGFAIEGKKIIDQGFSSGILGKGPGADREKRLRDLANTKATETTQGLAQAEAQAIANKDNNALFVVGYNYAANGQADKGIALMEQAINGGNLKKPDDEKLHLGIAYLNAGKKQKAVQTFKSVKGTDGTADLGRLWAMYAQRS